jgi:CBS domain-containing protein
MSPGKHAKFRILHFHVCLRNVGPGLHPYNFRFVRLDEPLDEALLFLEVSGARGVPATPTVGETGVDELVHFGYADLVNWLVDMAGDKDADYGSWTRASLCRDKRVSNVVKHPVEPLAIVEHTASLLDVCKVLVEKNAHRVFVTEAGVLVNVISPSMIAEFLLRHKSELDQHQLRQSLHSLGLTRRRPIYSVNESATLLEAFRYMAGQRVTGCAVMRGSQIVGTVSISDVWLVFEYGGAVLGKTCGEAVAIERKERQAPAKVATVTHEHTLLNLLENMVEKHIHRVWVVERDGSPCGTITYSDLVRVIVQEGYTDPSLMWGN